MKIISPASFITMPWKNGGGITHEILRRGNGDSFDWRLSLAEVKSDGPFSLFEGMGRILTVIEGDGLVLTSPTERLMAMPLSPLRFSGGVAIDGARVSSDVLDFNVIFHAGSFDASVVVLLPGRHDIAPAGPGRFRGLLALDAATVNDQQVPARSLCIPDQENTVWNSAGHLLLVDISSR